MLCKLANNKAKKTTRLSMMRNNQKEIIQLKTVFVLIRTHMLKRNSTLCLWTLKPNSLIKRALEISKLRHCFINKRSKI